MAKGGIGQQDGQRDNKTFKEVKRLLDKQAKIKKTRKMEDDVIEDIYVDKSRMISVKFGSGADDLKGLINAKGRKHAEGEKLPPGEPNLEMYLKLAESFMKKGQFEPALYWIGEAADFNSESAAVLSAAGRCHLLMGNWEAALGSAEIVLTKQPKDPKAILVKAEALFNLCYFELALMYFGRGQCLMPDSGDFRLGVQKCKKTIKDTVRDPHVFDFENKDSLFLKLRNNQDQRDESQFMSSFVERNSQDSDIATMKSLMTGKAMAMKFKHKLQAKVDLLKASHVEVASSDEDEEEEAKKPTRKKPQRRIIKFVAPQADRLGVDKIYLSMLSSRINSRTDIGRDTVQKSIRREASEAVEYLKKREAFWEMLDIGKDREVASRHVESYRFLM